MSREVHVHARPLAFAWAAGHSPTRDIVQLAMPEQQLNGPQILRPLVDQRCLGSPHGMRAIDCRIEPDGSDPLMHDPRVLACRNMG